jgi:hypothetical protein
LYEKDGRRFTSVRLNDKIAAVKILYGVAVVAVVAGGILYLRSRPAPVETRVARAPVTAPAPVRKPEAPPPSTPGPKRAPDAARKAPAPKAEPSPEPAAEAPAAPTLASLNLDSDVAGASVFIDREYVGTTPLKLDSLKPGPKQLKLSSVGLEGVERSVDLVAGDNAVTMRFKEVRLHARVAVTHDHAMGSCAGALVATVDGLAYETANKNDGFTLAWDKIESMTVDYPNKSLKVKEVGGKSRNFSDKKAANADALFVFQRDIDAARKKLASGYTAVR